MSIRLKLHIRYWCAMACLYGVVRLLEGRCSPECTDAMETLFREIDLAMRRLGRKANENSQ